jgi:hypothetical protein
MHQERESFGSRRADQQVPVVREDAVRDDGDRVAPQALPQNLKKLAVFSGFDEERRLCGGAVDQVEIPWKR